MTAIYSLAREIGAPFDAAHEATAVLGHYIAELMDSMETMLRLSDFDADAIALPVIGLTGAGIRVAARHGDAEALLLIATNLDALTDATDSDDGWPICPWLHAAKQCALALKFAIEEPSKTRWPAEAGLTVARQLRKSDARPWLVERLSWAVAHAEGRIA